MAFEFQYDKTKKILCVTVRGKFTLAELFDVASDILTSTEFPPNSNTLWDLRAMNLEGFDSQLMKRFVEARKQLPERGNAHLALVVSGDLAFGMFRMYEMLSDTEATGLQQQIRVFRDYAEGEHWLLGDPTET